MAVGAAVGYLDRAEHDGAERLARRGSRRLMRRTVRCGARTRPRAGGVAVPFGARPVHGRGAFIAVRAADGAGLGAARCPDIALAEAAIGAGLTGALLLDALGHIAGRRRDPRGAGRRPFRDQPRTGACRPRSRCVLAATGGAAVARPRAVVPATRARLAGPATARAASATGHPVSNAVTAVLLDFRAYDTFLEMGVLMLAGLGALLLCAPARRRRSRRRRRPAPAGFWRASPRNSCR